MIGLLPNMVASRDSEKRRKRKTSTVSSSRTLALEQAYVHDVYSYIASNVEVAATTSPSPVQSHVKQFIADEFEPGSILLDIGCSNGQFLNLSPDIVVVGLEHCSEWFTNGIYKLNSDTNHLVVGDVLYLPFRDEFFDGVLCCSVLHHLSTLERRINALREIARILKIGGKLLLTVTSGPPDSKEIESQDVLIRLDTDTTAHAALDNMSSEDNSDESYASSSTSSPTNSSLDLNIYENCVSPTSSEFDNCYTFVKKALKRFSLTSSIYSMKNSSIISDGSSKSKFSANLSSAHDEMCPIELRNIDDVSSPCHCSSRSSSTTGDSALSSYNRSSGCISQTSSNSLFPSSLLSAIREHLVSWKVQFTSTMAWYSLDTKPNDQDVNLLEGEDGNNHRFSLPVSFRKPDSGKNILTSNKNKVYASNGMDKLRNFAIDGIIKQVELNLTQAVITKKAEEDETVKQELAKRSITETFEWGNCVNRRSLFQKAFSLDQGQQQPSLTFKRSTDSSMPELRNCDLNFVVKANIPSCTPSELCHLIPVVDYCSSLTALIPLTDSHEDLDQIDIISPVDFLNNESKVQNETATVPFSVSPASVEYSELSKDCEIEHSLADAEIGENPSSLQQANDGKAFPKKLLRQRSFSADYQQETVKFQPELPRRFSASPNIGTHRYNNNDHTPHEQQISMESEESFVTIIPAIRCDSIADIVNAIDNLTDFDLDEEDELASADDISPNDLYSYSSDEIDDVEDDDEDAYCENLSPNAQTSDDTSISSVLEATIKSVSKSGSNEELPLDASSVGEPEEEGEGVSERGSNSTVQSPPNTLHRYYHLFRGGELESLIEEHVENLHIIDSSYDEYATSWCIVAEKIRVWTI